jgi:hypothetical protein
VLDELDDTVLVKHKVLGYGFRDIPRARHSSRLNKISNEERNKVVSTP